jgi:hypothetical protein
MTRLPRILLVAVAAALLVAAVAPAARAQQSGFDGERLAPAAGAAGGVFVERPVVPFHLGYGLGLFLHFADDAVVVRDAATGATIGKPLDGAVSTDLLGSIGLFDHFELALHLPLRLYYHGDGSAAPLLASRGIGDLRVVPKVSFFRRGDAALSWALGAALPVTLPTGDDLALRGSAFTPAAWRWWRTAGSVFGATPASRRATSSPTGSPARSRCRSPRRLWTGSIYTPRSRAGGCRR